MKGLWHHQPEDEYVVITTRVEGGEKEFRLVRYSDRERFPTIKQAKSHGFDTQETDDFNIGALRDAKLAAVLWMDEITDDNPEIMQKVALETGLES